MTTYSVADAKDNLSELIDRALKGEGVVITRHGAPVVELKPVSGPAQAVTQADIDWLAALRLQPQRAPFEASGVLVSHMRDEDAH
jgi:prevent-host-death family protein